MGRETSGGASGAARCHLWVRGTVQGVGFRFFAERTARRFGLAGLVRNLADGRVEVVAEGPKPVLEAFIAALRHGPAGAKVDDVTATWEPPEGVHGFRVQ